MANKTTRIKTVQAPTVVTYDLSNQLDGQTQTFYLPVAIKPQATHYLIFNSTVYRNSASHLFYTVSRDGSTLTTYFDQAPMGGHERALQLVVSDYAEGTGEAITEEVLLQYLDQTLDAAKQYTDGKFEDFGYELDILENKMGRLTDLQTTRKNNLVAAINELVARIAALEGQN